MYTHCHICPRRCGVNRAAGERGFCGETADLRVAAASLHRGEEPPVTGAGGSGTIFITGCGLGCLFCQNYQISGPPGAPPPAEASREAGEKSALGRPVSTEEFAGICLTLEARGAENVNVVTGSHAVPAIAAGLTAARQRGLAIPVLWNSSGYEGPEALAWLLSRETAGRPLVNVFLPDLKTLDPGLAARLFRAPDYPAAAAAAIRAMIAARPLRHGPGGVLVSGVMVRHLVLPGRLDATREVLRWFAAHCRGRALLSLMTQYTPVAAGRGGGSPDRFLAPAEYDAVLAWLDEFGIDDGYCQELVTGADWLPDFSRDNPFASGLSTPVWHC